MPGSPKRSGIVDLQDPGSEIFEYLGCCIFNSSWILEILDPVKAILQRERFKDQQIGFQRNMRFEHGYQTAVSCFYFLFWKLGKIISRHLSGFPDSTRKRGGGKMPPALYGRYLESYWPIFKIQMAFWSHTHGLSKCCEKLFFPEYMWRHWWGHTQKLVYFWPPILPSWINTKRIRSHHYYINAAPGTF